MRFQLASDLHLEHLQRSFPGERLISPAAGAELLVLAGDIANGTAAIDLFKDWPVPVLYVAGNHEFYGESFEQARIDLKAASAGTAIQFLDNDTAEYGGVRFLGATLWTDYCFYEERTQRQSMSVAGNSLNDHRVIRTQEGNFSTDRALAEHTISRDWLTRQLRLPYAGKTVVITHHGPHEKSVHPRFKGEPLNTAFISNLGSLVEQADVWVHGHVHDFCDYIVGKCRVVVNPRGYPLNRNTVDFTDLKFENPAFKPFCVIDTDLISQSSDTQQGATACDRF
jgi:predicted phosphodiesterase